MIESEWGPWKEHDGKGCPCDGMLVMVEFRGEHTRLGRYWTGIAGAQCRQRGGNANDALSAWVWSGKSPRSDEIIRYRIRKPRGLTILESLLENLPEEVDA